MGHVFISYARPDAAMAERVAAALRGIGQTVWIDRAAIGQARAYDRQIEDALRDAESVVVLWSQNSIASDWVRNEAQEGMRLGKLVPLLIDGAEAPLQFRHIQAIDLKYWRDDDADVLRLLRAAVEHRSPEAAPAAPDSPGRLGQVRRSLERAGLLFADRGMERQFAAFHAERFHRSLQFGFAAGALGYALLGIEDMINLYGSVVANQFRFVIAAPIMLGLFGLSLLPVARHYLQVLAVTYVAVGVALAVMTMNAIVAGGVARLDGEIISAVFIVILLFLTLLPLRLPWAILCAALPLAVQQQMDRLLSLNPYDHYLMGSLTWIAFLLVIVGAWLRERAARAWFRETGG